jgi:thiosulfate/3-mercaptopyruvate sulfurtransferase
MIEPTRIRAAIFGLVLILALAACSPSTTPVGGMASTPVPSAASYADPELLADAEWLAARLSDPTVRVVALAPRADYLRGHVPGAVQIDWADLKVTDTADPSIAAWQSDVEAKLGRLGVRPSDTVVVYDHGSLYAARLWWILDQLGHQNKRVLNGGLAAWQRAGKEVATAAPTLPETTYQGQPDPGKLATWQYVLDHLSDPRVKLVDARSPEEYRGENNSGARRGGHIPGAVNVDYVANARADEPRYYKSQAELLELYAARGVTKDKEVIAYCATGVRASVDYFALRLIGYPETRVYTGSWAEWGNREDLPIER